MFGVRYPVLLVVRLLYSRIINLFYSGKILPCVCSLDMIQSILNQVKYKSDCIDWIQRPELTWKRKTGDCEDYAYLAQALLKQIGIESQVLNIILKPSKYSHAVCVFKQSCCTYYEGNINSERTVYKVFSNQNLLDKNFESIEAVVQEISGLHELIWYGV